ncbi:MAG: hypothetical protein WBH28_20740 [Fuerstiella sp.]
MSYPDPLAYVHEGFSPLESLRYFVLQHSKRLIKHQTAHVVKSSINRNAIQRWLLLASCLTICAAFSTFAAADDNSAAASTVKTLEDKLGIVCEMQSPEFPIQTQHGKIEGRPAKRSDLETYVPILIAEFTIYPRQLIQKTELRRIVLCSNLSFAGQLRTAVPDFEHDTLYLDVARGRHNISYTRKVIHHEFFHLIDLKDDQSLYEDSDWAALNLPDFRYGNGGINAQNDSQTSVLSDRLPGFLNSYSTTGVEEDKAEVFAAMIVEHATTSKRTKIDAVLLEKTRLLQQQLKAFCPQLDEQFWTAAHKVDRR